MTVITSTANERVKAIRRLQERKMREESGLFYVEGLRIVAEAVETGANIETLVVAQDWLKSDFGQKLVDEQRAKGTQVLELNGEVFQKISMKDRPQGLAAVVYQRWKSLDAIRFELQPTSGGGHGNLWVALDEIADPGNLGTIMRTLDAAGGQGIILLDQTTDPYDPLAVRASMGALFTQTLVRTTLAEFVDWKHRNNASLVGTSDKAATDYHAYKYPNDVVILMGSERQGLSSQHLDLCDAVVSIPMGGRSDSLNLAVATGVVLYEIVNQRREKR